MSLTYETAKALIDRGEFGELRSLAEPLLARDSELDPMLRVLVAHALVHAGNGTRALSLMSSLDIESRAIRRIRSRARLVLGLANRSQGLMTRALEEFQRALHIAQEQGAVEDAAWAHLHLFRQLIDGHPVDLAPAMLPAVRMAVTKAGSPHASAFLHMCVAVLEGHNGRLNEALRHCDCARSLVSSSPNAWLECGIESNRAAILLADCRFPAATKVLECLIPAASQRGLVQERARAQANLGHLFVMTGQYERAIDILSQIASGPSMSRTVVLSAWEGIARAHLWQGELDRCDEMLTAIEAAAAEDDELGSSYGVRWAVTTRARLLLKLNRPEVALEYLRSAANRRDGADAPFSAALSTLTAQASAQCGQLAEAARELMKAERIGAASFGELQGQYYEAAASAISRSDAALSAMLQQRARSVWHEQGIGWLGRHLSPSQTGRDGASRITASEAINGLASAIDLAPHPRLLAKELAALIDSLGCSATIRSEVVPAQTSAELSQQVLAVGIQDGESWYLECAEPPDPVRAVMLSDIMRIGRTAVTLRRFEAADRARAALWPAEQEIGEDGVLFLSQEMRDLVKTAQRIATTDIPVLITGETGTGKEVLARLVHRRSARAKKSFVPFNCTSVPREMMDSQLFGHRRGAFTGANDSFPGVIRGTRGGTLLLDEIGDLGLESQPKLLRFLESGELMPLGEATPVHVDVRVIAATNADLDVAVSEGRFREDLYYRLNIVQLRIPPLRERRVEIPALSRHYLQRHANQFDKGDLRLSEEALEYLVLFSWPGNVRQLSNEMRRLAALAERDAIVMPEHLSHELQRSRKTVADVMPPAEANQVLVRLDQPMAAAVQHVERAMLRFAMDKYEGVEAVARALGLSRKGLYLKRQRYELPDTKADGDLLI
jgi:DNA-binding NtrC family response regulator/tetratricopeptide (TPR) repeat protein